MGMLDGDYGTVVECNENGCSAKATSTMTLGVGYADYCDEHMALHEPERQAYYATQRKRVTRGIR